MLRDVFDPALPHDIQMIRDHAALIARRELRRLEERFGERYGDAVLEAGTARSLADDALLEAGRQFAGRRDELQNLWAWLTRVIANKAVREADAALAAHAPGARAHWKQVKLATRRRAEVAPEEGEEERLAAATTEADALVARNGFSERLLAERDGEDPVASIASIEEGFDAVSSASVVEGIEHVVLMHLDEMDCQTWFEFKAAGFEPANMRTWVLGVSRSGAHWRVSRLADHLRGLVDEALD